MHIVFREQLKQPGNNLVNIADILSIVFQCAVIPYTPEKFKVQRYGKDPFTHILGFT